MESRTRRCAGSGSGMTSSGMTPTNMRKHLEVPWGGLMRAAPPSAVPCPARVSSGVRGFAATHLRRPRRSRARQTRQYIASRCNTSSRPPRFAWGSFARFSPTLSSRAGHRESGRGHRVTTSTTSSMIGLTDRKAVPIRAGIVAESRDSIVNARGGVVVRARPDVD